VSKEGNTRKPLVRKASSSSSSNDEAANDASLGEEPVSLRCKLSNTANPGVGVSSNGNGNGKRCRVLFSYSPAHEDELKLQLDDIIDFLGEVEDGWWRGKLRGRSGVFPSNFVEMISEDEMSATKGPPKLVSDLKITEKNKKNENMKGEGKMR